VEPVEEERKASMGGSAGGAFALREAEGSGKEDAVVQACCQKD
jgi:cephalosporin-C deacetylase-like acetyl esterase